MKEVMPYIHSFSHHLELSAFKEYPMEIAEVAGMAMELFSMENWGDLFSKSRRPEKGKRSSNWNE
jgi:oligoendopeptidase F